MSKSTILVFPKERNNKGSEQNQLTFTKSSFLAEIEGGPFEVKKNFFGLKSLFWVGNIF